MFGKTGSMSLADDESTCATWCGYGSSRSSDNRARAIPCRAWYLTFDNRLCPVLCRIRASLSQQCYDAIARLNLDTFIEAPNNTVVTIAWSITHK